jgi:tetratricopeptide (TPR) repeat protein
MNTAETIARLRELKSQSQDLRAKGDLTGSIGPLRSGIELGREALAQVTWELADCLGMLGGNLLRQGQVRDAIEAFRHGRDLEMSNALDLELTYNTVNFLVARVLEAGWETVRESRSDLVEVIRRLKARTAGSASGDVWAWADLGMCEFLGGRYDLARSAYARAASLATVEQRRSLLERLLMIKDKRPPSAAKAKGFFDTINDVLS